MQIIVAANKNQTTRSGIDMVDIMTEENRRRDVWASTHIDLFHDHKDISERLKNGEEVKIELTLVE